MKVMRADSLGMCFGVRDAVAMALSSPHRSDLTILGELVHNTEILRRLREALMLGRRDVSRADVLLSIAEGAGLDLARFRDDLLGPAARDAFQDDLRQVRISTLAAVVPEPGSLVLASTGVAGLLTVLGWRRLRSRRV